MRLELGSGDRPTDGFVHLDQRQAPDLELWGGAESLDAALRCTGYDGLLPRDTQYEEIRATHLLEHFSHRQTIRILAHWRSFLEPGGRLYLEVPNLSGHVDAWRDGASTDAQFVEYLYGYQDYDGNYHKTAFTAATLRDALTAAGYAQVDVRSCGLVLTATATS